MTKKQSLMAEMLEYYLVMVRAASEVGSEAELDLALGADLLHNLPGCLVNAGFEKEDLRWLEFDAASYEHREWSSEVMRTFFLGKIEGIRSLAETSSQ